MKIIRNGKMYNTETAYKLFQFDNGYFENDFGYDGRVIYRKKNGEYFAVRTCLRPIGSTRSYSLQDDIELLSEEEVKSFAEKEVSVEDFEKMFGEVEE